MHPVYEADSNYEDPADRRVAAQKRGWWEQFLAQRSLRGYEPSVAMHERLRRYQRIAASTEARRRYPDHRRGSQPALRAEPQADSQPRTKRPRNDGSLVSAAPSAASRRHPAQASRALSDSPGGSPQLEPAAFALESSAGATRGATPALNPASPRTRVRDLERVFAQLRDRIIDALGELRSLGDSLSSRP